MLFRSVPIGTVKNMEWDSGIYRVRTILEIEEKYRVPTNAVAKVQMSSLLGGNFINISVEEGPEETTFLQEGDEIETVETASIDEVMATFTDLSGEAEQLLKNLDEGQQETLSKIQTVIEENREDLNKASESFSRLGPQLEELADRLNTMTASVKDGEGTLGALYSDKELYSDLKEFSNTAKEVAQQVKSGEGSLGQLVYGDDLTKDAKVVMEDLQSAAKEVESAVSENREELKSLLQTMGESGPRLEEAIADLNEITNKINNGEGTLGRLVNDPSLYQDAQRTVNQVGESFESAEEQGVFRSFLGLVFGALI